MNEDIALRAESGTLTTREIAVVIEMNQKYTEYLDELETAEFKFTDRVITRTEGETIIFNSIEDVAKWITTHR